ncbi:MAG: cyclic nucleotide-binding domain-containing protein, partial [Pontibacterium sp.]
GAFEYFKEHRGQSAYIRDYGLGEQVGFMSMIALHNRVGSAVAKSDCQVLEVCDALFHRLHEEAPVDFGILMINLSREMARTLRSVDNLLVSQLCELDKVK